MTHLRALAGRSTARRFGSVKKVHDSTRPLSHAELDALSPHPPPYRRSLVAKGSPWGIDSKDRGRDGDACATAVAGANRCISSGNGAILANTQQHTLIRNAIQDIWNDARLDKADEFFAPDYVNHGGIIPDLVYGPEAIRFSVVLYRRAFPRLNISVDELRTDGNVIVMHWTARNRRAVGISRAPANPVQPDYITGLMQIRIVDGKIAESWIELSEASLKAIVPNHLAA